MGNFQHYQLLQITFNSFPTGQAIISNYDLYPIDPQSLFILGLKHVKIFD